MLDDYKEIQSTAYSILKNAVISNKESHAYLIETLGNDIGFAFALAFAKALLCPKRLTNNENCSDCNQCDLINDENFIELEVIDTEYLWLKKESIDKLQNDFNFKPVIGHKKVYIIKNADKIRENLANTLLKFIEEPEEGIIAILVTDNKAKILDTIISRCQIITLKSNKSNSKIDINDDNQEIIKKTIEFINYYEINKTEALVFSNNLLHDYLKDRNDYSLAFDVILMYYNDVLNYKLSGTLIDFSYYITDNLYKFVDKISIENILKKIDIVIELKKTILNNVNLNLLIDKLIISFKKVDKSELC